VTGRHLRAMSPNRSPLRSRPDACIALLTALLSRTRSTLGSVSRSAWRLGRRAVAAIGRLLLTILTATRRLLAGPVRRAVTGPVRRGLLGRRTDISAAAGLVAPLLALVAAWWVRSVGGYAMLEQAAHGTWTGTDPSAVIFLGLAALLALGTVGAAINSGLLPTGLLVAAPAFGAAVTRYGTATGTRFGPEVVSLPEAVGMAGLVAVGVTVPVTVAAFLLGYAVRRLVRVFGGAGPASRPEEV
jgi:hypothetical protein